jgi:hypothetical protein
MIKNMTPHSINIYSTSSATYDVANRKYFLKDGAQPVLVIPPSGELLNAKSVQVDQNPIDGVPIKAVQWTVDNFNPEPGVYYVVSALFKSAYNGPNKGQLLTVGDPVYADLSNPRPVGCLFLAQ